LSESGLSVGWTELQQEVGDYLGFGRTIGNWSAAKTTKVGVLVQAGVRRVYYPQNSNGHKWSFLRPTANLYLGASGTDGVVSGTSFDSATFTDWVTQGIVAGTDTVDITDGTGPTLDEYDISVVEAGNLTLSSAPGDGTSLTFLVSRPVANYNLPDDFGALVGNLHYATDENRRQIAIVPLSQILERRARYDLAQAPQYAEIRYKDSDGSNGQRQETLFWPRPDAYYPLWYTYEAYSGALSDSYPYPLGGMQMSELYIASCLAVAEQRQNQEFGIHTQVFQALLDDALARDRKRGGQHFGRMGHVESPDERLPHWPHGLTGGTYPIQYRGELI